MNTSVAASLYSHFQSAEKRLQILYRNKQQDATV